MTDRAQMTPAERMDALANDLISQFAGRGCELQRGLGELTLVLPAGELLGVARALRDQAEFRFALLIDLCGIDYGTYGQGEWETETASVTGFGRGVDQQGLVVQDTDRRYAVVYHLLSVQNNFRLRLRVYAEGEIPAVDSVMGIWASGNWFEREAFDLYGILFRGHSDLRRILSDYGFIGHPFRKDFPLFGQVEMRYDPEKRRVVYEPVSIEPRTLVPRVIREDNRFVRPGAKPQATPPNA
jgi:NADH-quinone oxidoreductase subunit C